MGPRARGHSGHGRPAAGPFVDCIVASNPIDDAVGNADRPGVVEPSTTSVGLIVRSAAGSSSSGFPSPRSAMLPLRRNRWRASMLKITLSALSAFAALLALSLIRDPAWAQSRVFVAAQGSDTNLCTFAAPCRTFQHAHDVVAANGEIDVLDPAGYGPITINKGISIQGHGFSGITATSGNAITINAGGADVVNLIGLIIEGAGLGSNGIVLNVGGSINIVDCMVRSFVGQTAGTGSGISISPVTGTTKFFIAHTIASD